MPWHSLPLYSGHQMWERGSLHQAILPYQLVSNNSVLTLSPWKRNQIPQAKDSVLQDHPPSLSTSDTNVKSQVSPNQP